MKTCHNCRGTGVDPKMNYRYTSGGKDDRTCPVCLGEPQPLTVTNICFFHQNDPNGTYSWPYVYLHGLAEQLSGEEFQKRYGHVTTDHPGMFYRGADDILSCNTPMPDAPGEYLATLYDQPVIAVLAKHVGDLLCGRVALISDGVSLNHCRTPAKWS